MSLLFGRSAYLEIGIWRGMSFAAVLYRQMRDCRYKGTHKPDGPSVDQLQLSWRLLYEIRTRPSGPTKSFKSYGLTSKKSVYSIRLSPPLVTILIEDDNPMLIRLTPKNTRFGDGLSVP
jgi:hypothetical protein